MEFYTGPKGSGKTTLLIRKSAETGAYIVCRSHNEASRLQIAAKEIGLSIPLPITYSEFLAGQYAKHIHGFLIDDLHGLFDQITNIPILAVTGETEE
jgi:hypothetical protein